MKKFLVFLLKAYKKFVSPYIPPSCRFVPTCSEYAMEAIEKYGILKGMILGGKRVLRCNPFCTGGFDPVP